MSGHASRRLWHRALPAGLCLTGEIHDASDVRFLSDKTWTDAKGVRHTEQQIFDAMFDLIRGARRLVLLDMFLINDFQRGKLETTRLLSSELSDVLVKQKQRYPDIEMVVITDPINTVYGSLRPAQFERMEAAGIRLVITDLTRLRDSNPLYSLLWRMLVKPLGNSQGGSLPNPFDPRTRVTIRSYLALLNYKANHRKVLIADDGGELAGVVSSANAEDAGSANVNAAIRFSGRAVFDLLASENAVLELSGDQALEPPFADCDQVSGVSVQVLTEQAIKTAALEIIGASEPGDRLDLAMFYLSDRDIIDALRNAGREGVSVCVILDPNKDAFGHRKYGIPNRPVAAELTKADVEVRWGHTHGEHCHAKMMLLRRKSGEAALLLGSANMTRRNLDNLNLETSVVVRAPVSSAVIEDAGNHCDLTWNNTDERIFSVPYDHYRNESVITRFAYRLMERSGWSTF